MEKVPNYQNAYFTKNLILAVREDLPQVLIYLREELKANYIFLIDNEVIYAPKLTLQRVTDTRRIA